MKKFEIMWGHKIAIQLKLNRINPEKDSISIMSINGAEGQSGHLDQAKPESTHSVRLVSLLPTTPLLSFSNTPLFFFHLHSLV